MEEPMRAVYAVRHRLTKEIRYVELGTRYDQTKWELIGPVSHLLDK